MKTYYNPEDLAKFGTIGEESPKLAEKFFDYYGSGGLWKKPPKSAAM